MYTILLVVHTIIVVFLIMMVLIQRTDSDGLSGLSGGGGNQFLTGRGTANLLTRTTAFLAAAFMITSLTLAVMASRMNGGSIVDALPVEAPKVEMPVPVKTPKASKDIAPAAEKDKVTKEGKPAPAVPKAE